MTDRDTWWEGDQERDDWNERLDDAAAARAYFPNLSKTVPVRESDETPAKGDSDRAKPRPHRRG